ncbi:proline-rich protein 36-like [Homalodisca vitripennis]|uniref:proline-rich protein 36-like n=1 Tax=Homalodisca vitripennis TaxID=197043 RepID=UPI001EEBC210|nr:proline-rich protein 36-like [Homalodisca vitripennis]
MGTHAQAQSPVSVCLSDCARTGAGAGRLERCGSAEVEPQSTVAKTAAMLASTCLPPPQPPPLSLPRLAEVEPQSTVAKTAAMLASTCLPPPQPPPLSMPPTDGCSLITSGLCCSQSRAAVHVAEVEPLSTLAKTVAMLASMCETPPQPPPLSLPPTDGCSLITSRLRCSRSRAAVLVGKDSGDVAEVEPQSTVAKTVAMLASMFQTPPQPPSLSLPPTDGYSLITSRLRCSRSRAAVLVAEVEPQSTVAKTVAMLGCKCQPPPQPPPLSLPPTDSCSLITSGLCCSRSRAAVYGGKDSGDVAEVEPQSTVAKTVAMLASEVEPQSTVAKTVAMLACKCLPPLQPPLLSLPPTDSCSLITSGLCCSRSRAAVDGGKDSGDVGL